MATFKGTHSKKLQDNAFERLSRTKLIGILLHKTASTGVNVLKESLNAAKFVIGNFGQALTVVLVRYLAQV